MSQSRKRLLELIALLPDKETESVLEFVEFLVSKVEKNKPIESEVVQLEPELIDRPQEETVVAAIKRLSKSYPMLDKAKLLNVASNLMSQHVMQGREAMDVIDELEELFQEQYRLFAAENAIEGSQS